MNLGNVLASLRTMHGLSQREFASILKVSNGAVAMWETNKRQPDLEMLKKIAKYYNVPIDYILRTGIFENWDLLIANKDKIIKQISDMAILLSVDMLNGLDNISFVKLVYAFDISITEYEDGIGIIATAPIATYPKQNNKLFLEDTEWLSLIHQLPPEAQHEFRGELKGYLKLLNKKSVAADAPSKKTEIDNPGKSLPSNGTEGDTRVG